MSGNGMLSLAVIEVLAAVALSIVALILAVFGLTYLWRDSRFEEFDDKRRHQLYVTAWVYIGVWIFGIAVFLLNWIARGMKGKGMMEGSRMNHHMRMHY